MLFEAVDDDALREAVSARGNDDDDGLIGAIGRDELSLEMLSKDFYVEGLLTRDE